jgi:UPF0716 protein FxsA
VKYIVGIVLALSLSEMIVLLLAGNIIGVWPTLLLVICTGIAGVYTAKKQGLETLRKAQQQIQYGQMPGSEIIDGICIMVGGLCLLLPGFVSDIIGLILVLPPTRSIVKPLLIRWMMNRINKGKITIIR